jgi:LCP family protein required for cell wall assembly
VFGALLMLGTGTVLVAVELVLNRVSGAITQGDLFGGEQPENYGEDIDGPLNILLAGLDTRPSRPDETPRADAIMVVHIDRTLGRGWMVSIPRDTLVQIPPEPTTGYLGGTDRINSAMYHGANPLPTEDGPNVERGFSLLAETVENLTGIEGFDAGVVMRFEGFRGIVDAMGGINVALTERIVSEHRQPDGSHRELNPYGEGYLGPQMVYEPGAPPCGEAAADGSFECELEGWHALDVARQRYGIEGADYGRGENQQRVLQAIMDQAFSRDLVTNPLGLDRVLQAAGDAMIFDGRGNQPVDFAFALRELRSSAMTTVTLPGRSVGTGSAYQGEELEPEAYELFDAIRLDQVDQYLAEHPDFGEEQDAEQTTG